MHFLRSLSWTGDRGPDVLTNLRRFYGAGVIGLIVWVATFGQHPMLRVLLAADTFFALFVLQFLVAAMPLSAERLRGMANTASRASLALMVLLAAAAVILSLVATFTLLNHPRAEGRLFPIVAVASVPLSWAMMHTIAAIYYAHLYYSTTRWGAIEGGLRYPEDNPPDGFDFIYHAFVIGTSCSVSEVNTTQKHLRAATLIHSLASFAFNTVLIAVAVNAAMTFAG